MLTTYTAQNLEMKLLIVDDNPDTKPVYEMVFPDGGFDVKVITNSPEAVTYLDQNFVDAVLLDLAMPGMDGLTLAKQIRINEDKNGRKRKARLAWFTGRTIGEVEERVGRRCGVEETFQKPVDPVELVWEVKAWLSEPPKQDKEVVETVIKQDQGAIFWTITVAVILMTALILTIGYYNNKENRQEAAFQNAIHQKEEENAYRFAEQRGNYNQMKAICEFNWEQSTRKFAEKGEKDVVLKPCILTKKEGE